LPENKNITAPSNINKIPKPIIILFPLPFVIANIPTRKRIMGKHPSLTFLFKTDFDLGLFVCEILSPMLETA